MYPKEKEQTIKKIEWLSEKYHRMSLLFYELSQSLKLECKNMKPQEFKEHLKGLGLDFEKIKKLTKGISEIELNSLRTERGKGV